MNYPENSVDVVALIYAHLPVGVRQRLHRESIKWLKPGGYIIIEAFNIDQLKNCSGGPKDVSMLLSERIIEEDFSSLQLEFLLITQAELQEGEFHKGKADILRFIGLKA
jgi:hypothetical protein